MMPKRRSIAFKSGVIIFTTIIILFLIMIIILQLTVNREIKSCILDANQAYADSVAQQLDFTLSIYRDTIQKEADKSTFVRAVMDPVNARYYLPDYMRDIDLRVQGSKLILASFDGKIIHSTSEYNHKLDYIEYIPEWDNGDDRSARIRLHKENDKVYICIFAPVEYNSFVEGILIAHLPFKDLFYSALDVIDFETQERNIIADYENLGSISYGVNMSDGIESHSKLISFPINITVISSKDSIQRPIKQMQITMLLIGIFFALAGALILTLMMRRTIVNPIQNLRLGVHNLSKGVWKEIPLTRASSIELQELSTSFNQMQKSLKKRTTSLEEANKNLYHLNRELKTNQIRLVRSEKMASIGQLAAGVAHEINNPTGFVMSNLVTLSKYVNTFKALFKEAEILKNAIENKDTVSSEKAIKTIDKIKKDGDVSFIQEDIDSLLSESIEGTKRIKEIVLGLSSFAREDDSSLEKADINKAVEDALRLTWNELKYKCEVHTKLGDLPPISCHIDQLTQVFINILMNSAQAISDHGEINIKTKLDKDRVNVKISDTGHGIASEHLSKLFDPFFTTKEVGKGTGLGLAISHGIIEKHGGTIEVESSPGQGTQFTVSLPLTGNGYEK